MSTDADQNQVFFINGAPVVIYAFRHTRWLLGLTVTRILECGIHSRKGCELLRSSPQDPGRLVPPEHGNELGRMDFADIDIDRTASCHRLAARIHRSDEGHGSGCDTDGADHGRGRDEETASLTIDRLVRDFRARFHFGFWRAVQREILHRGQVTDTDTRCLIINYFEPVRVWAACEWMGIMAPVKAGPHDGGAGR